MKISESESLVMSDLWRSGPSTAEDIVARLASAQDWKPATVKTLINRLMSKGAIVAERDGRRYVYSAVLSQNEYVGERSRRLIDRFFGGRVAPLVSHLSDQESLTEEDIEELKRLIERIEDDR